MQYNSWTPDLNLHPTNRFVYIKQNTSSVNNAMTHQTTVKNTILINPNFKSTTVHINPKFTGNGALCTKPSVYINPNIFTANRNCTQTSTATYKPVTTSSSLTNYNSNRSYVRTATTNNVAANRVNTSTVNVPVTKPIVSTPMKIVRLTVNPKTQCVTTPGTASVGQKQRIVKSKYKIIKTNSISNVKPHMLYGIKSSNKIKSKFKIDNRMPPGENTTKTDVYKIKHVNNSSPRKRSVTYIKIGGVIYKNSRMTLQRSSLERKLQKIKRVTTPKRSIHKIINKNGIRYEVNVNRRALKRMSDPTMRSNAVKRSTIQKKKILLAVLCAKNDLLKSTVWKKKSRQHTPPSASKLRKCNVPCPFYRKFGRCRGKDRGTCNKVHDPTQIIICPRFLQGACISKTCLLSHNVSAEKMPTCKFFLEGMCSREDCPYLHVKVNPKAEICPDFLKGFCKQAKECNKRHQYLCPEYEKNGKCSKKKCLYPHGNVVRSVTNKKQKLPVKQRIKQKRKDGGIEISNKQGSLKIGTNYDTRYYKESLNDEHVKDSEIGFKRSKLDKLPCFIPLADCSEQDGC